MIEECSSCKRKSFIVNKTKKLCDDCNYKRLHGGKTKKEVYMEKPKRIQSFKKVNKVSDKQKEKNKILSEVKRKIEEDSIREHGYLRCEGCHCEGMDKSHIISIGQNKSLELEPRNIQLMCRECHTKWESRDINVMKTLFCFKSNLKIMKDLDLESYNKLIVLL